ncbi:MAG TPA: peptidoglycan-binding protein LysM [Phaeodactylibacter sp.]|nr:peptidoglycan-binding protein LysM [Phaeodactylibacter sp.]
MGLFSFLKKAGASALSKKEAVKVEKTDEIKKLEAKLLNTQKTVLLQQIVTGLGVKGKDLKVKLNGDKGKVTVSGQVGSNEDREKIILALGNVSGIAAVDDRLIVKKKTPEAVFYTVQKGDTLGKIAKSQMGKASLYKEIFKANQPMLKSPDKIFPGQVLRIPAAKK